MGTSYDIRCIDCNETAGLRASYDPVHLDTVQEIISHAVYFAGLADMDTNFEMYACAVYVPTRWLTKHLGHRLRPVSEYGEVDGTCAKYFHCEHCASRLGQCDKDVGHEGACEKREPEGER
jgi:hypothetical protein